MWFHKCHCGSGMHPRHCKKHPWGFKMHVLELNHESLSDYVDDLEKRLKECEIRLGLIPWSEE